MAFYLPFTILAAVIVIARVAPAPEGSSYLDYLRCGGGGCGEEEDETEERGCGGACGAKKDDCCDDDEEEQKNGCGCGRRYLLDDPLRTPFLRMPDAAPTLPSLRNLPPMAEDKRMAFSDEEPRTPPYHQHFTRSRIPDAAPKLSAMPEDKRMAFSDEEPRTPPYHQHYTRIRAERRPERVLRGRVISDGSIWSSHERGFQDGPYYDAFG